jgi:hypothetical protein
MILIYQAKFNLKENKLYIRYNLEFSKKIIYIGLFLGFLFYDHNYKMFIIKEI